jgi:hypothetical protein
MKFYGYLLLLAFFLAGVLSLLPERLFNTAKSQVLLMPFYFSGFYGFTEIMFGFLRKKLSDYEGFFFMGVLVIKFLALAILALALRKETIAQNHSVVLLFVVCYFAFLVLYVWHMVHLLGNRNK